VDAISSSDAQCVLAFGILDATLVGRARQSCAASDEVGVRELFVLSGRGEGDEPTHLSEARAKSDNPSLLSFRS
jgi:hypothetical protein